VIACVGFLIRLILEGAKRISVAPAWAEGARTDLMTGRQAERRTGKIIMIARIVAAPSAPRCNHLATGIALAAEAEGTTICSGRGDRNGGGWVDVIC
jgi:hypothetical protein